MTVRVRVGAGADPLGLAIGIVEGDPPGAALGWERGAFVDRPGVEVVPGLAIAVSTKAPGALGVVHLPSGWELAWRPAHVHLRQLVEEAQEDAPIDWPSLRPGAESLALVRRWRAALVRAQRLVWSWRK